jgi:hypothetical protein
VRLFALLPPKVGIIKQLDERDNVKNKRYMHCGEWISSFLRKKMMWNIKLANCVPCEDHEILTEGGFMRCDAVEARMADGGTVSLACPRTDGSLEFHPIGRDRLTKAMSADFVAIKGNNIDVMPTTNHRMWTRVASSFNHGTKPYAFMTAEDLANAKLPKGGEPLAQFMASAPLGRKSAVPIQEPAIFARLGLLTDDHKSAFLELYGYWLGDGWLAGNAPSGDLLGSGWGLWFGPVKKHDHRYLDALFARLPLQKHPHASNVTGGYWRAEKLTTKGGQRNYAITEVAWIREFARQYGKKYHHGTFGDEFAAWDMATNPLQAAWPLEPDQLVPPPEPEGIKSAKWHWDWTFDRLTKEQILVMLKGLHCADGCQAANYTNGGLIYTSSARFRDEIQRLALFAGCTSKWERRFEARSSHGTNKQGVLIVATVDAWQVSFTDYKTRTQPVLSCSKEMKVIKCAPKPVWCVSAPTPEQLIIVRRVTRVENGIAVEASRPIVMGNTSFMNALNHGHPINISTIFDHKSLSKAIHTTFATGKIEANIPPGLAASAYNNGRGEQAAAQNNNKNAAKDKTGRGNTSLVARFPLSPHIFPLRSRRLL